MKINLDDIINYMKKSPWNGWMIDYKNGVCKITIFNVCDFTDNIRSSTSNDVKETKDQWVTLDEVAERIEDSGWEWWEITREGRRYSICVSGLSWFTDDLYQSRILPEGKGNTLEEAFDNLCDASLKLYKVKI